MGRHVEGGSIRWKVQQVFPGYWRAEKWMKDYGYPYDWKPDYATRQFFGSQPEAFAYAWGQIKRAWEMA